MPMKKTYTHIVGIDSDGEIMASIYKYDKLVGSFEIIGEWEGKEDIMQSLHDEAGRLGYVLLTELFKKSGSEGGKKSSSNMTPEERKARAKKASDSYWKKKKSKI